MPTFTWRRTGDSSFPLAAPNGGRWYVLRQNDAIHPNYTVFKDGLSVQEIASIEEWPVDELGHAPDLFAQKLPKKDIDLALRTVKGLRKYRSEDGTPCEDPWCCGALDDDD